MMAAVMFVLGTLFGGLAGFAIGAILFDGRTRIRRPRKIQLEITDEYGRHVATRPIESEKQESRN